VLDIEDAKLDPSLSHATTAGAGSTTRLGAGGSDGDVEADPLGAGGASAASVCERYCTAVTQNCSRAFAVYTSVDTCLAVCAALPEGTPSDRDGNTVQCRLHAGLVATDEVAHYCPIAGPGGNGVCGSNCESLCQLRDTLCADEKTDTTAACLQNCAKLKDLGTYSTARSAKQDRGPHVQCRLYHVSAAAVDDAELQCKQVDGAAPCK
jgi:hypothetical protein